MKKYEKPSLTILLLSGNETICGGCANKMYNDDTLKELVMFYPGVDTDGDGVLTKTEASKLFGPEESCAIEINEYCKFTSTGNGHLSWS